MKKCHGTWQRTTEMEKITDIKKITMKCNLLASISYFQNNQFNSSNYLQAGWTTMLQVPFSYKKTSCQLMSQPQSIMQTLHKIFSLSLVLPITFLIKGLMQMKVCNIFQTSNIIANNNLSK